MACKYWYDGKWRSEKEFKNILKDGLLDRLLKDNTIDIQEFTLTPEQRKEFTNLGAKQAPVTVRIRHKAQTNINNERAPETGDFVNNNPLKVIETAVSQGATKFPFTIVIKVKGELETGKGSANKKIKEELEASPVNIKAHLKEGIPYMLIPSSYGLYPIQLKSHKIGDTKFKPTLRTQLQNLSKATNTSEVNDARKTIEKALYRTTVEFKDNKFIITKYDPNINQNVQKTFTDLKSTQDFLEDQLFRVDYTEINRGIYNESVANLGVVTTDLFSEKGNFFNSSSFILEPYMMSTNDQEVLNKVLDFKDLENESTQNVAVTSNQGFTPVGGSSSNKQDESTLFNTSLEDINKVSESTVVRKYSLPNTNKKIEVVAGVIDGKLTVQSVTPYTVQKRKNANDLIVYGDSVKSGELFSQGTSLFFADKNLPKISIPTAAPISTDAKADIEKKYPEYVKNFKQSIFDIRDIVRRLGTTAAASKAEIFDNVVDKFIGKVVTGDNIDEAIKGIVVLGSKGFKRTFIGDIKQEFNKIGQLKKEYDAELAALETVEEQPTPQSIIQKAAQSFTTSLKELASEQPQGFPEQDLSALVAQSTVTTPEDITETSDDVELPDTLFGDVDFDGDFDREEPNTKLRATKKTDATQWSKEQELAWLEEKLGNAVLKNKSSNLKGKVRVFKDIESLKNYLPKETYEMLLESRKQGKELHGVFTKAALYISKNAAAGTTFHEAFHIVFNLALPLSARIKILNEAYTKFKDELPLVKYTKPDGTEAYRMPSFLEVEELLADKFMEYVQSKEAEKFNEKNFETTELGKTFKGMYRMLRVFFNPGNVVNIEQLFSDINFGVYKFSVKFGNTRLPESTRLRETTAPQKRYDNPIEEREAFTYLETVMDEIIETYKNSKNLLEIADKDAIQQIGVHKLYALMLSRLNSEYSYNRKKGNIEGAKRLYKLFDILTDGTSGVKKVVVNEKEILQFTKSTDLLDKFTRNLKNRGLYITYQAINNSTETAKNSEDEGTATFEAYNNEEETYEESWVRGYIETNPMESVSQRLKSFFATIPKYKSNRKNAAKVINSFGVAEKENPGVIFKKVIAEISNSYTMTDMMVKLNEMNKKYPYVRHILERIEKDPILKTELWVSVASKNYATFAAVYEANGSYSVFNSNRKTLDNIIKEELIAEFLQPSNPLFISEKGKTDFDKINPAEATRFRQSFESVLLLAQTQAANLSAAQIQTLFGDISRELSRFKLNVTAEDFNTIWAPEGGKPSWSNIVSLLDTFRKIGVELEKGVNPFTSLMPADIENREDRKVGRSLVEQLGRQLIPAMDKEIISSFRNIEGKTVYNLILSGFLNKQIETLSNPEKFSEYIREIAEDPLMSKLPFIKDLGTEDSSLQEYLQVVLLDGLTRKGKNQAVSYSDMSDIEQEATSLGLFFNSGAAIGKDKRAYYKLPIPSDSPTIAYIQAKALSNEEIIDKLVDVAAAEYGRIQKVKSLPETSRLARVVGYKEKGSKFQILDFLNGKISTTKRFNEAAVREAIQEFLNGDIKEGEFFKNEINFYKKKGIITAINETTGELVFADKLIDKSIKREDRTEFFKNYLLNTYYMNTQMTTLFGGDSSFYKNTVDFQKRYKQVLSPGLYTNTENQPTYYKGVILKDSIMPTDKAFGKYALDLIKKSKLPESEKNNLSAIWTSKFDTESPSYEGNNETDGATWISPKRRKQQLESLGRWTPEHEAAMKRIETGKDTIEDLMLINTPFKPEKPFVFTHRIEDGTVVPTQVKNAETVLTKSFAETKTSNGSLKYPKLAALYQDMVDEKFDVAMYESAVKEGAIKNISGDFSEYTQQPDGSYKISEDAEVFNFKTEDWRLQQETPPHYIDDRGNFGTQLRTLIIGDINLKGDYFVGNQKVKGADVVKLYQELVVEDLKASFAEVKEMFENKDGSINYERLSAELRKEVLDRELGEDYLDALAIVPDALGKPTTALPLYHPLISYKMESVMNSFFKNRVTKQKIAGGALINTTSFGVSDYLKMKKDPKTGGIVYEAMLPAWSKDFFPKNKEGEVDIEALKADPQSAEILRIIGYRIPTEHKYSMFNIEVVGFTPPAMGGTVILPVEATTIAGLDFDIDKLYFMSRAFKKGKNNNFKPIKYIESISSPEQAKEVATDIYGSFRDFKRFVKKNVKLEVDQERMIEVRRELLEKEIEAKKIRKADNAQVFANIQDLKNQREFAKKDGNLKNSSFFDSIQSNIDELYMKLQEEFLPFEEDSVEFKQSQDAIDFITNRLLKDFNPLDFNTKQARDNKKLDIIQGILENTSTSLDILNPGNFDVLKESATRIRLLQAGKVKEANSLSGKALIKESDKLDTVGFNINFPSTQLELFRRNMTGKQLIGIFANHNTHHAKGQLTTLRLKNPIIFNNEEYVLLNQVKNSEGLSISRVLATDLAAVVDNAKEPLAAFLNLNTFTANTVALLQRAGVDNKTVWAFVNQPVITELTQRYFNDRGSLSEDKHFNTIKNKWRALLKAELEKGGKDLNDLQDVPLTREILEKNLFPSKTTEYYTTQFMVLQAFEKHYKAAEELALGIQAAKVDTVGVGPTSASNYVLLQKQTRVLDKVERGENYIEGSEEIFLGGSAQQMIPGFTKYGLFNPINILNKIFPSIGQVSDSGDVNYSALGLLKDDIAAEKTSRVLTEKEAHMIDIHFMNFIASGFPFFEYSQSEKIITSLPERIREFKASMPEGAPYRAFIDQLYVVEANVYSPIRRIEYYNTGKTPIETQQIKTSWQRMLEDADPKVKELGLDLIKYTFFSNGYGFGPYSFANLVPVKFWTNEYQLMNNIVDQYNRPFNDYLKSALDSSFLSKTKNADKTDKLSQQETAWEKRFINQFIRNNASREGFVQTVKIDRDLAAKEEGTDEATLNNVATIAAKDARNGIIRTSKNTLIINREKNPQLFKNRPTPVKYIKVFLKNNKVQIYQHMPTEYDMKDPAKFQNKRDIDTATYMPVGNLGTSNFLLEYNFYDNITDSVLSKMPNTPNPKLSKLSMAQEIELEMMSNVTDAGSLADLMISEMVDMGLPPGAVAPPTVTPKKLEPKKENTIMGGLKSLVDPNDINNSLGLFEQLDKGDYTEYQNAGGTMSEQEFLSLNLPKRQTAIWQAKNCK